MARAIMVQGTASGVGKSWLCTGLCRLLARRGLRVAPFKAQNMSNNSAPAEGAGPDGEIGRAQAVQAEAAGLVPHVDMNPVLLKPTGETGAQVVVQGRPEGHWRARAYRARRERWWRAVLESWERLSARFDVIVVEGAGSPAEINLRAGDIVNMGFARRVGARVLLVGDIDRGGVFAALHGTVALLDRDDRALVRGLAINRFRGDPAILEPGLRPLEVLCGVPVLGVLPFRGDLRIDEEDGLEIEEGAPRPGALDVCAVRLPAVSNSTDLRALGALPDVSVRWVDDARRVGWPDLLVLPGSKDTLADLAWMRGRGLDRAVRAAAARGVPVLGICGGYQLLGERLADPEGLAGRAGVARGLGLLPVETRFGAEKRARPARGRTLGGWLLPAGLPVRGYEIRQGRSRASGPALVELEGAGPDGAVSGLVAGTYLHGLLDAPGVAEALADALWRRRGLAPPNRARAGAAGRLAVYDAIADLIEERFDLAPLLG